MVTLFWEEWTAYNAMLLGFQSQVYGAPMITIQQIHVLKNSRTHKFTYSQIHVFTYSQTHVFTL